MTSVRNITKLFSSAPSSIDEVNKTVTFRISDGKPDRQGEIVDQQSWDFKDYMSNPLLILSHDSSDIENGVGTAEKLWYDAQDDATYGSFKIATEASSKAATAWNLIKAGILRTVSVGFISNEVEYNDDGTPVLKNNQLLETSLVLIPANPRAIALAYKERSLSEKDAEYVMKTMRSEADEIEKELKVKESSEESEKSMDDVKSQLSALTDAMTKLAEAQAAQVTAREEADQAFEDKLAALNTTIESLKPAEKTDDVEDKPDDKATEGADTASKDADKPEADKTDPEPDDEKKDADKKDDDKKSEDDPDVAKGGSDDQPGANADELDEDAEITPEQQAQIDRELEEAFRN